MDEMTDDEALCAVQVSLMELASTVGVNSDEYRRVEQYETDLIRRMNEGYFTPPAPPPGAASSE